MDFGLTFWLDLINLILTIPAIGLSLKLYFILKKPRQLLLLAITMVYALFLRVMLLLTGIGLIVFECKFLTPVFYVLLALSLYGLYRSVKDVLNGRRRR